MSIESPEEHSDERLAEFEAVASLFNKIRIQLPEAELGACDSHPRSCRISSACFSRNFFLTSSSPLKQDWSGVAMEMPLQPRRNLVNFRFVCGAKMNHCAST